MTLLLIALGGAVGAVARYIFGGWVRDVAGAGFPWATLMVNLVGCLLIGFSVRLFQAVSSTPDVRALITVGLLGAFTTFSTFSYETVALLEDGAWWRAGTYAAGSVLIGIMAVYAGTGIAGWFSFAR